MSIRTLIRWLRLPYKRRILDLEAFGGLVLAMLLVKYVPFRRWSKKLADPVAVDSLLVHEPAAPVAREVSDAIRRIDRVLGYRFTCLMQAIAGKWMLNRRGIANTLVLGVCTERDSNAMMVLKAHAWLHCGLEIVLGGEMHQQFTPISRYHSASEPRPDSTGGCQPVGEQDVPVKGKPQ